MLRVRFSEKAKQLIVSRDQLKNYFELIDEQAIEIFLPSERQDIPLGRMPERQDIPLGRMPERQDIPLGRMPERQDIPNKYTYQIVDEDQAADICIVGIQHTDNSLLRSNEFNIFLSVENFSVGRTHYQHFNKFKRDSNPLINLYLYNDVSHVKNNLIPVIYNRVKYFNSIYSNFESIRLAIPFEQKKFCLFTSRNGLNPNKQLIINQLSQLDAIDFLDKYDDVLKDKSCYNSPELVSIYSQYKFIICFENSKTDGYVTEKIFNVFLSGSIPIYDGAPNITDYIVPGSFIQYDENIVKKIKLLMNNKTLYNAVINKNKTKELDYSILDNLLEQINL